MDRYFEKLRKSQKGEAVLFIVFAFVIGVWVAGQIRLRQETNFPKISVDSNQSVENSGEHAR